MAGGQPCAPTIEPLAKHHATEGFSCGVDALDAYLMTQAGQDARRCFSVPFVLIKAGNPEVLGFYTLAATSIPLDRVPEPLARRLPRYALAPAILIGRLAVARRAQGRRYGELLLMDALKRCLTVNEIGWFAVIVDATNDRAVSFYQRYEFIRLDFSSSRLMLPRKTLEDLFY
jgi:GNAT superfamily N-acetyltransferase